MANKQKNAENTSSDRAEITSQPISAYPYLLFVPIITLVVYLSALQNNFIHFDDPQYVVKNLHIRSFNLELFRWAFFDFYVANWHPLAWISHAIDYAIWGLNPRGHHFTNIVIHVINSSLVTILCINILRIRKARSIGNTPIDRDSSPQIIAAGAAGLLFGIHPVHVESVAWIAERKDLLCAAFFLLSVLSYTSYVNKLLIIKSAGKAHLYASFMFFTLALMSKPMAVSLPLVLLILDFYPFRRFESLKLLKEPLLEKLPFIVFSALSSLITIMAQKSMGAMFLMESIPFGSRLLVAVKSLFDYLVNIAVPVGLSPFYPYPPLQEISLLSPKFFLPVIFMAGVIAVPILNKKARAPWIAAWGYYLVALLPVLGIVQVGGQPMADRYLYLPGIAPFLVFGIITARAWIVMAASPVGRLCFIAVSIAAILFLSLLTHNQISIWKNGITFCNAIIEKEPIRVPEAYFSRGSLYEQAGQFDQAVDDYNTAVRLKPDFVNAYINRGHVKYKQGLLDSALEDFDAAGKLKCSPEALYRLHLNRGVVLYQKKHPELALHDFNAAIAMNPQNYETYYNRVIIYKDMGQFEHALEDYSRILALKPDYAIVYIDRGNLYLQMGNRELAAGDFQKACTMGNSEGCTNMNLLGGLKQ